MENQQSAKLDVPELSLCKSGKLTEKGLCQFLRAFEQHFDPMDAVKDSPYRRDVDFLLSVFARYPDSIYDIWGVLDQIYRCLCGSGRDHSATTPENELLRTALMRKAVQGRLVDSVGSDVVEKKVVVDAVNASVAIDIDDGLDSWKNAHLLPEGTDLKSVQAAISDASESVVTSLLRITGGSVEEGAWAFLGADDDKWLITARDFDNSGLKGHVYDKKMEIQFRETYPYSLCLGNIIELAEKWGVRVLNSGDIEFRLPNHVSLALGGVWYFNEDDKCGYSQKCDSKRLVPIPVTCMRSILPPAEKHSISIAWLMRYKGVFVCEVPMV
jgi:hypothetical protein